jgi:hypothetical protein
MLCASTLTNSGKVQRRERNSVAIRFYMAPDLCCDFFGVVLAFLEPQDVGSLSLVCRDARMYVCRTLLVLRPRFPDLLDPRKQAPMLFGVFLRCVRASDL